MNKNMIQCKEIEKNDDQFMYSFNKKNVLKLILDTITEYKMNSLILLLSSIGVVIVSIIPPQILKVIVDDYLTNGNGKNTLKIGFIYFVFIVVVDSLNLLKQICLTVMGQNVTTNIRISLMRKVHRLRSQYFTENESGSIVSRFSNDVDSIESLFSEGIISMAIDISKIIFIIISLFLFSYKVGVLLLFIMPIIFVITRIFQKKMLLSQIKNRKLVAAVSGHIPETLKNIDMIKSFSAEKFMENKYKTYIKDNYKTVEKVNFYDSIFSPIILMIRAIVIAIVAILCSKDLNIFGMTVGMVAASIEYISNIFAPIQSLGMELQSIQKSISGIKRIDEFLAEDEKERHVDTSSIDKILDDRENISINIENVTFFYDKNETLFNGFSEKINPKENVTFRGRTGIGKSTIFKLILGLLSPQYGSITINGINTSNIPDDKKRMIFGYVEQSFHFIKGNIKDQITLFDPKVTDEAVIYAMKFVGLHDYVSSFKDGYDTQYSESLFSKGQEQLLSIARAIVLNPPIMLFDEITANLDSKTEEKIIKAINNVSRDRILISISHRLSNALNEGRVVFLDKY